MTGSSDVASLAPVAGRVIRRKTVTLVAVAALVCGLASSLLWLHGQHAQLRSHHDAAYPLLLEWNVARVGARLDAAREELAAGVRALPAGRLAAAAEAGEVDAAGVEPAGAGEVDAAGVEPAGAGEVDAAGVEPAGAGEVDAAPLEDLLAAELSTLLEPSGSYGGLLLLDPAGGVLSAAGSGPEIEALVEAIQPRTALQSQLVEAMRSVQLRKDLTSVTDVRLRPLGLPGLAPLVVGGAALRAPDGSTVAFLHAIVSPQALALALSARPLGGSDQQLALVDADGKIVVRGSPSGGGADHSAATRVLDFLGDAWSGRYERPLGRFGWTLVAEEPTGAGLATLLGGLVQALALTVLLAMGFGLLAHWIATGLVQPLWSLYESMRLSVRDTKAVEVPLQGAQGEAESLIQVFNVMTRRAIRRREETERSQKALQAQNQSFQAKHASLSKLTITDPLTQLANRRFLEEQMSKEIKRLARTQQGLSMLVIDIDDFKKLNDRYGHAAGDEFLKQVAGILREHVRATDLVARFGGEEFVVLATGTDLEGGSVLAEKLRTAVAEASFIVDETMRPRRATISVGVAQYRGSQMDLFNSADAALYEAKSAGKNCVISADLDADPPR
ncbi:MAG: GGDEF domain-containing protein [Myxococcota bacterium]|nr:GGDEF domain-containing protein [Myxococcota bacterium]